MMGATIKTIEVEAPTIEDAIRAAVKKLHVPEKEIKIEVLKEEQKGLFGMEGAEPARIKATLKHPKAEQ